MSKITVLSCVVSLSLCACGPQGGIEGDDEIFERTIVRVNPDGTQTVKTEQVTRAQQREELARRKEGEKLAAQDGVGRSQQAITADSGCAGTSLWLYDGYEQTGNQLCLAGQGVADLNSYCRTWGFKCIGTNRYDCYYGCTSKWGARVRSYYGGVDHFYFEGQPRPTARSAWGMGNGDPTVLAATQVGVGFCPGIPMPNYVDAYHTDIYWGSDYLGTRFPLSQGRFAPTCTSDMVADSDDVAGRPAKLMAREFDAIPLASCGVARIWLRGWGFVTSGTGAPRWEYLGTASDSGVVRGSRCELKTTLAYMPASKYSTIRLASMAEVGGALIRVKSGIGVNDSAELY